MGTIMKTFTTAKSPKRQEKILHWRNEFEEQLHQMYWCELQLAQALPKLAKLATSYELTSAILAHLAVTENQIIRLIHVFDAIGDRAVGQRCPELETMMTAHPAFEAIDSGYERDREIIASAQELMQFEVAAYGKLHLLAVNLNEDLAAEFLALAIKEEKNAFARLTEIKLSSIYFDAAS